MSYLHLVTFRVFLGLLVAAAICYSGLRYDFFRWSFNYAFRSTKSNSSSGGNVSWWEEEPYTKIGDEGVQWLALNEPLPRPEVRNSPEMARKVQMLTDDIAEFFDAKMKSLTACQMAKTCPVRTIIFDVTNFTLPYGGAADRLRATFYAAMASNRVYKIKWEIPSSLAGLFNGPAFDDLASYEAFLRKEAGNLLEINFYFSLFEPDVALFFTTPISVIRINANGLHYLRGIYQDPKLRTGLKRIILRSQMYGLKFSYELATFIALRILFRQPRPILSKAINKIWQPAKSHRFDHCRIGVQLRMAPSNLYERYHDYPRATQQQIEDCFLPKVVELAEKCSKHNQTSIVYIASDSVWHRQFFRDALANVSIISFNSGFEAVHVDSNLQNRSAEERQQILVETFAEWFVLERMNQLVISRSGYAELASTFGTFLASRRPTIRLPHGYNVSCNFEDDYYIKSADPDNFQPPDLVHH